jgi:hypothetical protein
MIDDLLARLRVVTHTNEDIALLKSRSVTCDDTRIALLPHVCALNADVDAHNEKRLQQLPTEMVTITAKDSLPPQCKQHVLETIGNRRDLPTVLQLKVGARVMLVRNIATELGLFNGAFGTITGFLSTSSRTTVILVMFDNTDIQKLALQKLPQFDRSYPIERFDATFPTGQRKDNRPLEGKRLQFPMKLAFALTIHKCQGQTMDLLVVSLEGHFGPGQAYVAIGRCRTLNGLYITDFDQKSIKVNTNGLKFVHEMKTDHLLPIPHDRFLGATQCLRISVLNTRSLSKHAKSIRNNVYLSASDIVVLTETRLKTDQAPAMFSNCPFFAANSTASHGFVGGVAIASTTTISSTAILHVSDDFIQLIAVEVNCMLQLPFVLLAVYRSPQLSLCHFTNILSSHLTSLINLYRDRILITGDLNIDAPQYRFVVDGYVPLQVVSNATYTDGHILDHVYWIGNQALVSTDVIACPWSDHNIVCICLSDGIINCFSQPTVTNHPPQNYEQSMASSVNFEPNISETIEASSTSAAMSHAAVLKCDSLTIACNFLDSAMGPDRTQMDITITVEDLITMHNLTVLRVLGDGHCLLRSWAKATNSTYTDVKQLVFTEFTRHSDLYIHAGVSHSELQKYLQCRNYQLNAVDAVINMLCNATQTTALIVGQKYIYHGRLRPKVFKDTTEVKRISPNVSPTQMVLLLILIMHCAI